MKAPEPFGWPMWVLLGVGVVAAVFWTVALLLSFVGVL